MAHNPGVYAKAIVAGLVGANAALVQALGDDGLLSTTEIVVIAFAGLVAGGVTYVTPNATKEPANADPATVDPPFAP